MESEGSVIMEPMQPRVFLWCLPRTVSTAITKCLSFVDGVQVWHEPYATTSTAASMSDVRLQGDTGIQYQTQRIVEASERVATCNSDFIGGKLSSVKTFNYDWVQTELEKEEPGKSVVFIKDMCFAIDAHYDKLPRNVKCVHTFLIRHPYRLLPALRKFVMHVFGYQGDQASYDFMSSPIVNHTMQTDQAHVFWKHVKENTGSSPIVIDTDDLLQYPEKILPKYFQAIGIPWDDKYLTWDTSNDVIKKWRGAVEFAEYGATNKIFDKAFLCNRIWKSDPEPLTMDAITPDTEKLVDLLMPGYLEMYETRLKPTE